MARVFSNQCRAIIAALTDGRGLRPATDAAVRCPDVVMAKMASEEPSEKIETLREERMADAESVVDVAKLIDDNNVGKFQLRVLLLCAAIICVDGFDLQAIGYIAPTLSKDWHLSPGALGPAFSASLFGVMIGALTCGPLADRFGRKWMIITCALWFGVCSLLTVFTNTLTGLMIVRFVGGLAMGGVMPNAIALTGEYSPQRSRATMIMIMFCGMSLGAVIGGAVAAKFVPLFGWRSVFWIGAVLPLLLGILSVLTLPESIHFLALQGRRDARLRHVLARMNPKFVFDKSAKFTTQSEHAAGFPVNQLFTEGRAVVTLLMWVVFFMNLLVIYFLANWLPTVINNSGLPVEHAVYLSTLYHVGAIIAALTLGLLIDRFGATRTLFICYILAGLFIIGIGSAGSSIALLAPVLFAAGYCVVGAQGGANATAAIYYPTSLRSTGIGWALGVGRIGSILGPALGGIMISQRWSTPDLFLAGSVPEFLAAAAIMLIIVLRPRSQNAASRSTAAASI